MTNQTTTITGTGYVVCILGGEVYETPSLSAALRSLPKQHALAQIYGPGTYETNLPWVDGDLQVNDDAKVGDELDAAVVGKRQDSGGGTFYTVTKRRVRIDKIKTVKGYATGDGPRTYAGLLRTAKVSVV